MIVLKGVGISEGIAFGKIFVNKSNKLITEKYEAADIKKETDRYKKAKEAAVDYTKSLYKKVLDTLGKEEAEIFKAHELMLKDKDFEDSIIRLITEERTTAEYAISETSKKFSKLFSDMPDPYMKNRAIDVIDISKCMIDNLLGKDKSNNFEDYDGNVILVSEDFTPSEITSMNKDKIKGFICTKGSTYSHSSILLRVMKIPGIICLKDFSEKYEGKYAVFDGSSSEVYIEPKEMILSSLKNRKLMQERSHKILESFKGKENITLDGRKIKLYANMNNPGEIDSIIENDSGGIGLLRSEFIYLKEKDFPSEETQFEIYKNILEKLNGKEVIIRTLDIGSDKKVDYFNLPCEQNPAMGYRGIRVCLDRPEIFKIQLRAIYRASAYGNVSIMFPMVTSLEEVIKVKKYIKEIENELESEKIPFSKTIKKGIMIETPAAVMVSDELAKEVDFFSIGTNDLTQYTLAVDRQNGKVNSLFDTHNKSLLRMIDLTIKNAHKNGITVGICGESAADESLLETYLALGVDELSVSAPFILKIRKKIRETDISSVREKILSNL